MTFDAIPNKFLCGNLPTDHHFLVPWKYLTDHFLKPSAEFPKVNYPQN